jgi:hypothetical protein
MVRATLVALATLYVCDYFAYQGRYTDIAMKVVSAIQHSFV